MKQNIKLYLLISLVVFLIPILACSSNNSVMQDNEINDSKEKVDYMAKLYGKDYVLAPFMWEDGGFSETQFYPAEILTEANAETNGEYEVQALIGNNDVAKDSILWTKNIILKNHKANKDELKLDLIVLWSGDNEKVSEEEKAAGYWSRVKIINLDNLHKDMVTVKYFWKLDGDDEADREYEVSIDNLRIIDNYPYFEKIMNNLNK